MRFENNAHAAVANLLLEHVSVAQQRTRLQLYRWFRFGFGLCLDLGLQHHRLDEKLVIQSGARQRIGSVQLSFQRAGWIRFPWIAHQ
ncbi:MAG: hypothetical protein WBN32_11730, partial [Woeseia sp.]